MTMNREKFEENLTITPAITDIFRRGVYTRHAAAYLARVKPQTVTRWFDTDSSGRPVINLQIPDNEDGLVSFDDLIQLLGVREIRLSRHISLQKIRAIVELAKRLDVPSPFIGSNTKVHLYRDEPILETPTGEFLDVTGQKSHEPYLIKPVIMPFLNNLTIVSGVATQYRPMPGILLSPTRHWGAPLVERCNCLVSTLVTTARAEGSTEIAARMCGVEESDVIAALGYEDFLSGVAA